MPNKHRSQYLEPSRLHSPILMRIMKGQFRKVAVCSTPTAFDVIPFHFVGKPEKEVQSLRLEVGCPLAHMLNLQLRTSWKSLFQDLKVRRIKWFLSAPTAVCLLHTFWLPRNNSFVPRKLSICLLVEMLAFPLCLAMSKHWNDNSLARVLHVSQHAHVSCELRLITESTTGLQS